MRNTKEEGKGRPRVVEYKVSRAKRTEQAQLKYQYTTHDSFTTFLHLKAVFPRALVLLLLDPDNGAM